MFPNHKVVPQPQKKQSKKVVKSPKKSLSALTGDQAAVTLAINRSIFIEWPKLKVFVLKKVSSGHTRALVVTKNCQKISKISQRTAATGDATAVN